MLHTDLSSRATNAKNWVPKTKYATLEEPSVTHGWWRVVPQTINRSIASNLRSTYALRASKMEVPRTTLSVLCRIIPCAEPRRLRTSCMRMAQWFYRSHSESLSSWTKISGGIKSTPEKLIDLMLALIHCCKSRQICLKEAWLRLMLLNLITSKYTWVKVMISEMPRQSKESKELAVKIKQLIKELWEIPI